MTAARAWIGAMTAIAVLAAAAPVWAGGGEDFAPASEAWNGLGYLRATAAEAKVKLRILPKLDWNRVDERQILLVIAPKVQLDAAGQAQLVAYLDAGGRLIVADDFRAGASWVRPFGLQFSDHPGPTPEHDADRRYLPVVGPADEPELADRPPPMNRFLGFEVSQIVLNHPAALLHGGELQPGWRRLNRGPYLDGVRSWLVEVVGPSGRVLAVADSSLFINGMLTRYRGNKQFAANVMRYYCVEDRPCEVLLLANLEDMQGVFRPRRAREAGGPAHTDDVRAAIGAALAGLANALRTPMLRPLAWFVALLLLAIPIVMAGRLPAPLLPPRASSGGNSSVLFDTVRAWLARPGADYRRPARQLALHLARLVALSSRRRADEPMADLHVPQLHDLSGAIDVLVEGGQLGRQAGDRINDVIFALRQATIGDLVEVDRQRFTQLAAEVEWAEHVLSHTGRPG